MAADDPLADLFRQLAKGNERAAQELWTAYFERLAGFAKRKLDRFARRVADEEDVALSAMNSFCRGVAAGRFPRLDDQDDLWRLLVTIAARKVTAERRRQTAARRGGGKVRGESVFFRPDNDNQIGLAQTMGREPTPEMANIVAEDCEQLMRRLDDDSLRQIAILKLEGYLLDEIAGKLGCAVRTVERKIERIRKIWTVADAPRDAAQ